MLSLIIIPTYNEIENLKTLVHDIFALTLPGLEILIIDDHSPDGTGILADQLAQQYPGMHVLHRPKKMGLGTAYITGFQWGLEKQFEAFIEMDADFSHRPAYLIPLLNLLKHSDVVIGSRYIAGGGTLNWGVGRKLLSRGGSWYAQTLLGAPIQDFTGGFNGWKRTVLETLDLKTLQSNGYSFQIELKYRAFLKKFKITEFPILFEDRKVGQSKMHLGIIIEALWRILKLRYTRLWLLLILGLHAGVSQTAHATQWGFVGGLSSTGVSIMSSAPSLGSHYGAHSTVYGGGLLLGFQILPKTFLEFGLLYLPRGFDQKTAQDTLETHFQTVQMPILLKFQIFPALFFGVGGYFSYGLGSVYTYSKASPQNITSTPYGSAFHPNDYGFCTSFGVKLGARGIFMIVDSRYLMGFRNIQSTGSKMTYLSDFQILGGIQIET